MSKRRFWMCVGCGEMTSRVSSYNFAILVHVAIDENDLSMSLWRILESELGPCISRKYLVRRIVTVSLAHNASVQRWTCSTCPLKYQQVLVAGYVFSICTMITQDNRRPHSSSILVQMIQLQLFFRQFRESKQTQPKFGHEISQLLDFLHILGLRFITLLVPC